MTRAPACRRTFGLLAFSGAAVLAAHPAWAQAHNPFGVGISEGGGAAGGLTGWLIGQQALYERQLSAAVRAARADPSAGLLLAGLSFAYGVFHAAGPGHGKAVITSYLFANERALKRGLVLSLLAALLQGLVAVLLVGVLALLLHETAQRMKNAASLIEEISYAGVAVLGAWLVWRKGRLFLSALAGSAAAAQVRAPVAAFATSARAVVLPAYGPAGLQGCSHDLRYPSAAASGHVHGPGCGHRHAPDPALLGDAFSWRDAILTVVAAGSRPCSGAILILVFALAQGSYAVGIVAVLAMSMGTALTTGALASMAVLARHAALKLTSSDAPHGAAILRGLELAAAVLVLGLGLLLLAGAWGSASA